MSLCKRELAKRIIEKSWQEEEALHVLKVCGDSMPYTLPNNSLVRVQFMENTPVTRGDLICFRRGESRIVHRAIFVLGFLVIEKGEGNALPCFCVRSQVLGLADPV